METMKFKMKRVTILIFCTINVALAYGPMEASDRVSKSNAIDEVKNRNKNHTTSVPGYYVIQRSDSNDIEGAIRII
jgi:hypothetical protein